jgi:hypothetical protein
MDVLPINVLPEDTWCEIVSHISPTSHVSCGLVNKLLNRLATECAKNRCDKLCLGEKLWRELGGTDIGIVTSMPFNVVKCLPEIS